MATTLLELPVEEIAAVLGDLPSGERDDVAREALSATAALRWVPNPGPQSVAYYCEADELLYGGQAGGGKTDLVIGLALTAHRRALILRRMNKEVEFLVERAEKILGTRDGYNGQKHRWRLPNDQLIQFGGCQHPGDERGYKGEPKDFLGLDEASEFLESQVDFLLGWMRTGIKQRCRAVFATNPPLTAEGEWVIKWFAPWLDETHDLYPQPDGRLLWYVRNKNDSFRWLDRSDPVEVDGRMIKPISRTFIRSGLSDNPDYAHTDYAHRLAQMPEALRRRYAEGDFTAGMTDQEWQVIPTAWIKAAQERWRPDGWRDYPMTAMAYDPAGGGKDAAELCWRHGGWFAPIVTAKGEETADGSASAAMIVRYRRDGAPVIVDVGGGYGGAVCLRLKDNGVAHVGFNGANSSAVGRTRDGQLRFANKRAQILWRLREALDPDQEGDSPIALPNDPELRADLAAATYEVSARGILVEDKDSLRKRLGRSPGKGDAVAMCLSEGNAAVRRRLQSATTLQATANLGYANLKRRC